VEAATIISDEIGHYNRRFAVQLRDGAVVESVLYRESTLCVSSQVGCGVRCPFCASGANGLGRSLAEDELDAQLTAVERHAGVSIAGVTVSGVGEPLHNFDNVTRFVERAHRRGVRVTLTTSGGPVQRLATWLRSLPHQGLTISVHAGTEAVRARAVPKGPDLASLFAVLATEVPQLTRARRKKTALAYLALAGVNESDDEVDAFIARALPLGLIVHLYAHNPVPTSDARGVERARYEAMYERMKRAGLVVRMSARARLESNGGCGTLVAVRRALAVVP
jgi:23S rRNA (adenine2503-C2)-methyltransferase